MTNNTALLTGLTVDRLEQLELERNQTWANPAFQQWMADLNVSSSWVDNTYILNAREAMREWDASRFRVK